MPTQLTSFRHRLTLQQDAFNLLAWLNHQLVETADIDLQNLLRWEDDGGLVGLQTAQTLGWSESELIKREQK